DLRKLLDRRGGDDEALGRSGEERVAGARRFRGRPGAGAPAVPGAASHRLAAGREVRATRLGRASRERGGDGGIDAKLRRAELLPGGLEALISEFHWRSPVWLFVVCSTGASSRRAMALRGAAGAGLRAKHGEPMAVAPVCRR